MKQLLDEIRLLYRCIVCARCMIVSFLSKQYKSCLWEENNLLKFYFGNVYVLNINWFWIFFNATQEDTLMRYLRTQENSALVLMTL